MPQFLMASSFVIKECDANWVNKTSTYFHTKSDDMNTNNRSSTEHSRIIADVCRDGLLYKLASRICKNKLRTLSVNECIKNEKYFN